MSSASSPFRIAILGDLTGRASRRVESPGSIDERPFIAIDRDDYEDVLARLGVELYVAAGTTAEDRVRFSTMDDFHPDRLFRDLDRFRELRDLRSRLLDPATFADAAASLLTDGSAAPTERSKTPSGEPTPPEIDGDRLLAEMLSATEGRRPADRADELVEALAREIIAPHLLPGRDPRQKEFVASVDGAIGRRMGLLLHDRFFQSLEALWRSIELAVRRIETSAELSLHLLDVTKEELAAHLGEAEDAASTALFRRFVDETVGTPGAPPWSLIVVDALFEPGEPDVRLLARLASIGAAAGAPVVAGAGATFLGIESFREADDPDRWPGLTGRDASNAWQALRRSPEAGHLGLVAPRFLIRLPYGKRTSPVETFDFEEISATLEHERYLWGNGALLVALGLATSFRMRGWRPPRMPIEIAGLPLHVRESAGEKTAKPCAEILLTDRAAERIAALGIMTLRSVRDTDRVLLARLRSVHETGVLQGRWGSR